MKTLVASEGEEEDDIEAYGWSGVNMGPRDLIEGNGENRHKLIDSPT